MVSKMMRKVSKKKGDKKKKKRTREEDEDEDEDTTAAPPKKKKKKGNDDNDVSNKRFCIEIRWGDDDVYYFSIKGNTPMKKVFDKFAKKVITKDLGDCIQVYRFKKEQIYPCPHTLAKDVGFNMSATKASDPSNPASVVRLTALRV